MGVVAGLVVGVGAVVGAACGARGDIIIGSGPGAPGVVQVHSAGGGVLSSFLPFEAAFSGGVRVAVGDVNGDGRADYIAGAGPGSAGGHVRVFSGATGGELRSFFAYSAGFSGGVHVAAGDVSGDGFADVVTGAGFGSGGGHVRVFSGSTGAVVSSFFAYDAGFSGGVRVATGDLNGDGVADIITGAGVGGGGHVKVFSGADGSLLRSFLAYGAGFSGGVFVAAGDVDGDGFADIITGVGDDDSQSGGGGDGGASSHIRVFSGATGELISSFFAFEGFSGGVRVAVGDVNGDGIAEIIAGTGAGAGAHVRVFSGATGGMVDEFFPLGASFTGGIYVAAIPGPAGAALFALAVAPGVVRRRRRR